MVTGGNKIFFVFIPSADHSTIQNKDRAETIINAIDDIFFDVNENIKNLLLYAKEASKYFVYYKCFTILAYISSINNTYTHINTRKIHV